MWREEGGVQDASLSDKTAIDSERFVVYALENRVRRSLTCHPEPSPALFAGMGVRDLLFVLEPIENSQRLK